VFCLYGLQLAVYTNTVLSFSLIGTEFSLCFDSFGGSFLCVVSETAQTFMGLLLVNMEGRG
jgi:hypothetical protein